MVHYQCLQTLKYGLRRCALLPRERLLERLSSAFRRVMPRTIFMGVIELVVFIDTKLIGRDDVWMRELAGDLRLFDEAEDIRLAGAASPLSLRLE
jgi:hypothetical protein